MVAGAATSASDDEASRYLASLATLRQIVMTVVVGVMLLMAEQLARDVDTSREVVRELERLVGESGHQAARCRGHAAVRARPAARGVEPGKAQAMDRALRPSAAAVMSIALGSTSRRRA